MTKDGFTLLVMDENAKIRFLLVGSDVLNFEPIEYKDQWNRKQVKYNLFKDGFTLFVMGYNTRESVQMKPIH